MKTEEAVNAKRNIMSVQSQLGIAYEKFMKSQPCYETFEDFLKDAGIPV